jgi:hypothetical protein
MRRAAHLTQEEVKVSTGSGAVFHESTRQFKNHRKWLTSLCSRRDDPVEKAG